MTFQTESARDDALAAFHKARKQKEEGDDNLCTKIVIRKDLTPLERQEEEELFQELKSRRDESEKAGDSHAHWVKKRGRIENIGRYPVGGQEKK
ncbi:hypothetical protein ACOMHN_006715 [Nucella lapillus]